MPQIVQDIILGISVYQSSPLQFGLPLGLSDSLGGQLPPQRILNPQCPYQHVSLKSQDSANTNGALALKKSIHVEHSAHTPVTPAPPPKESERLVPVHDDNSTKPVHACGKKCTSKESHSVATLKNAW